MPERDAKVYDIVNVRGEALMALLQDAAADMKEIERLKSDIRWIRVKGWGLLAFIVLLVIVNVTVILVWALFAIFFGSGLSRLCRQ